MLPPGTVVGFLESLLPNAPLKRSHTAASFVHLLYFDRAAVMAEAERRPQLLRSLWWFVAAQVRRRVRLALVCGESNTHTDTHTPHIASLSLNHTHNQ